MRQSFQDWVPEKPTPDMVGWVLDEDRRSAVRSSYPHHTVHPLFASEVWRLWPDGEAKVAGAGSADGIGEPEGTVGGRARQVQQFDPVPCAEADAGLNDIVQVGLSIEVEGDVSLVRPPGGAEAWTRWPQGRVHDPAHGIDQDGRALWSGKEGGPDVEDFAAGRRPGAERDERGGVSVVGARGNRRLDQWEVAIRGADRTRSEER